MISLNINSVVVYVPLQTCNLLTVTDFDSFCTFQLLLVGAPKSFLAQGAKITGYGSDYDHGFDLTSIRQLTRFGSLGRTYSALRSK